MLQKYFRGVLVVLGIIGLLMLPNTLTTSSAEVDQNQVKAQLQNLESQMELIKEAYAANPTPALKAALDEALAAYEAFRQANPGVFDGQRVHVKEMTEGPRPLVVAGPDAFGYMSTDSTEPGGPAYSFVDISGTGTLVVLGDDSSAGPLPLGFTFNFYGTGYTDIYMSSNGFLTFGGGSTDFSNDCPVPNANTPNNAIYPLWDDLDLGNNAGQDGYYQTFSPCPNTEGGTGDCTIFMWNNAQHWPSSVEWDFEAILYDNGNILINVGPGNPETGSSSTTGIENSDASIGLTHVCDTAGSVPDNYAVLFYLPPPRIFTDDSNGNCLYIEVDGDYVWNGPGGPYMGTAGVTSQGAVTNYASPGGAIPYLRGGVSEVRGMAQFTLFPNGAANPAGAQTINDSYIFDDPAMCP